MLKERLRPLVRALRRASGRFAMRTGRIGSATPLSDYFGYDRGTPIDRYYIEGFLHKHSADVKGHVLEVQDDDYSKRFGGPAVTRQDILSLHADNPLATIVGDIAHPTTLPPAQFDCIILTQTLQYVFDIGAAVRSLREALRPDGAVLITVPCITRVEREAPYDCYWYFTECSLRLLLGECFDKEKITVETFGNLFAATAFLHGAAVADVSRRKLDEKDPSYPVTVAARAIA